VSGDAEPGGGTGGGRRGRFGWPTLAALALLAAWLGTGGHLPRLAVDGGSGAAGDPAAAGRPPARYAAAAPLARSRPVRLDIPAAGVHAPLAPRGLDRAGAVDPPPFSEPGTAWWYDRGPAPGQPGAALLVGHVDTTTGAAVFYPLSTVRAGDLAEVTRADGTVAEFTVEGVQVVPKARFDARRVFGPDGSRPELRLVTCGGAFDRATHAYTANVVAYAVLTGEHPAARPGPARTAPAPGPTRTAPAVSRPATG
jgi:hypothetical protein